MIESMKMNLLRIEVFSEIQKRISILSLLELLLRRCKWESTHCIVAAAQLQANAMNLKNRGKG